MLAPLTSSLLRARVQFTTDQLDVVTEATRLLIPHQPVPVHRGERFYCALGQISLTHLSLFSWLALGRFDYRVGAPGAAFFLRLRLHGACEFQLRGKNFLLTRDSALIQSPEDACLIKGCASSDTLGILIEEPGMATELASRLGHPLNSRLRFAPVLDMRTAAGQILWRKAMDLCRHLEEHSPGELPRQLRVRQLEGDLLSVLIDGHRHNYTRELHRSSSAAPWQVRAAEEFIREHAAEPLSLGDLCIVSGVNARTLQSSFRKHRGFSPMQFLRDSRLERVREGLLAANPGASISAVAAQWGFLHFGRFAAEYRKRFGESPSRTLRRGQRKSSL